MTRFFILFISAFCFLLSCSTPKKEQVKAIGKGGKIYGGKFNFMSKEKVDNLFPLYAYNVFSQRINLQIFETLLKTDPKTNEIVSGLAESYKVSTDGKKYTFKIRKGVHFHSNPCFSEDKHLLNAYDVKYTLEFACSGLEINKQSSLLLGKIKGSKQYYNQSSKKLDKNGIAGIKVIDDYTLQVELENSYAKFDLLLTHPSLSIFPIEAYQKYGDKIGLYPIGTGPFILNKMSSSGVLLSKNNNYWRSDDLGNKLPFLDTIEMSYIKAKKSELESFKKNEIDMVMEVPVEHVKSMFGSLKDAQNGKNTPHKVFSQSSYSVNYIAFSCAQKPFDNPKVRKAINYAVDRNRIVEEALNGEGYMAKNGVVPEITGYNSELVVGVDYNPTLARKLLKEAGFPNGKGFPPISLWVNTVKGTLSYNWCMDYVKQLKKVLNIDLKIKLCNINERELAIEMGEALCWRAGWVADFPDAESFLGIFYSENKFGKNGLNAFQYVNNSFDKSYLMALVERDPIKRGEYLVACDQQIIDDAVVVPVYRDDFLVFLNLKVRDFSVNSMEIIDLSAVYIKEIN